MKASARARKRFAICVQNPHCDELQVGKVYETWTDRVAATAGHLRVLDDSGEDYLYPANYFVFVELPQRAQRAIAAMRPEVANPNA
jgi:hypothetical protein